MLGAWSVDVVGLLNSACLCLGGGHEGNTGKGDDGSGEVQLDVIHSEKRNTDEENGQRSESVEWCCFSFENIIVNNNTWNAHEFGELIEADGVHLEVEVHEDDSADGCCGEFPTWTLWHFTSPLKEAHPAHALKKAPSQEEMIGCEEGWGRKIIFVHDVLVHHDDRCRGDDTADDPANSDETA